MTFDSLHADTDCDCLGEAFEDTEQIFARKISKPNLRIADFYSHWERNKKPSENICTEICKYKGISVNYWDDLTQQQVIDKYVNGLRLIDLSTQIVKDCILIFRFKSKMGSLKYSPTKLDSSHYTFFKSDTFDIQDIEIIDTIELKDYVKPKI
ncbi:MAG: hypothetical protein U5N85_15820 [Arcicella sp.]|nr:hypothetical protein [Arcicella sp.]